MGHNIEHYTYKENVSKKKIQAELDNYVKHCTWQEGGSGTGGIRWIDHVVCKNYEEAKEYIEKHDRGWYDCLAVRYYEYINAPDNVKLKELHDASQAAMNEWGKRDHALYPAALTSSLITCKRCGSKLSREWLHKNVCPVCGVDLRPEHIMKSIEAAKNKYLRAHEKEEEYRQKHLKKEPYWLVKIEYHT